MAAVQMANPLTFGVVLRYGLPVDSDTGEAKLLLPNDIRGLLMTIFQDPVHTEVGMAPNGFTAIGPGTPNRLAELGPGRLSARTNSADETARTIVTLYRCVASINKGLMIQAYGINLEFEFPTPNAKLSSGEWLATFLKGALKLDRGWTLSRSDLQFAIEHRDGIRRTVKLEERAGNARYVFANVNNHHPGTPSWEPDDARAWDDSLKSAFNNTSTAVQGYLQKSTTRRRAPRANS